MLSTIPCSGFLYLQFLAQCHPYILFYLINACFTHFSLIVTNRGLPSPSSDGVYLDIYLDIARAHIYMLMLSVKIRMREIELVTLKMASHIVDLTKSPSEIVCLHQRIMYDLYPNGSV